MNLTKRKSFSYTRLCRNSTYFTDCRCAFPLTPQGIIFRFKFLMLATLTCAALTIIFFILNQVSFNLLRSSSFNCSLFFFKICLWFVIWTCLGFLKMISNICIFSNRSAKVIGTGETTLSKSTVLFLQESMACGTCTFLPLSSSMPPHTSTTGRSQETLNTQVRNSSVVWSEFSLANRWQEIFAL